MPRSVQTRRNGLQLDYLPAHAGGMIYLNLECFRAALFDLQAYLAMLPVARDAASVRRQVIELQAVASRLN